MTKKTPPVVPKRKPKSIEEDGKDAAMIASANRTSKLESMAAKKMKCGGKVKKPKK